MPGIVCLASRSHQYRCQIQDASPTRGWPTGTATCSMSGFHLLPSTRRLNFLGLSHREETELVKVLEMRKAGVAGVRKFFEGTAGRTTTAAMCMSMPREPFHYFTSPGGRYLIGEAFLRAAIVSSTVSNGVVWRELRAPPAAMAIAVAAIETLSGASHRLYAS
jgi:hypothetical protein